ncbi:MAG: thiol peroxidase [candidate division KSB1 bacterium]|nr:thiol peroxidase [candidate division KSB1 bacterium]
MDRTGIVSFKGRPATLVGPEIKVGAKAPAFTVLAQDFSEIQSEAFANRVTVLASVPSLDTSVCDAETKRFNDEAAKFGDNVNFVIISCDLPHAQKRWCAATQADKVKVYSDHRDRSFGRAFGVYIKEAGLLWRAVFVVDKSGVVQYAEYVPEMGQHPNYDKILEAVRKFVL